MKALLLVLLALLAQLSVQATLAADPEQPSYISSNIFGKFIVEAINCDKPTDDITFNID